MALIDITTESILDSVVSAFCSAGFEKKVAKALTYRPNYWKFSFTFDNRNIRFSIDKIKAKKNDFLTANRIVSGYESFFSKTSTFGLDIDVDGIVTKIMKLNDKFSDQKENKRIMDFRSQIMIPYIEGLISDIPKFHVMETINPASSKKVLMFILSTHKTKVIKRTTSYNAWQDYSSPSGSSSEHYKVILEMSKNKTYSDLAEVDEFDSVPFILNVRGHQLKGTLIQCLEYLKKYSELIETSGSVLTTLQKEYTEKKELLNNLNSQTAQLKNKIQNFSDTLASQLVDVYKKEKKK